MFKQILSHLLLDCLVTMSVINIIVDDGEV